MKRYNNSALYNDVKYFKYTLTWLKDVNGIIRELN